MSTESNAGLMPYRSEPTLERLREENARLREQLEALTSEPLLPHTCILDRGRRAHPARMRRYCQYCQAIYYEKTKDMGKP